MGMDSFFHCVCIHDQKPCPQRMLDNNTKKIEKREKKSKNEQINNFTMFWCILDFFV